MIDKFVLIAWFALASTGMAETTLHGNSVSKSMHSQKKGDASRPKIATVLDHTGKEIDSCFYKKMPTLVAVATGERDLQVLKKLHKDFMTGMTVGSHLDTLGALSESALKYLKGETRTEEPPAQKSSKKGVQEDVQLVVLTDSRKLWPEAYGQGWQIAKQKAIADYPILLGGPLRQRLFIGKNPPQKGLFNGKFLKTAGPQVAQGVPEKVGEQFDATAKDLFKELTQDLSAENVRIGGLMSWGKAQNIFPPLGATEPRLGIYLLDVDGRVIRSWDENNADGTVIAFAYRRAFEQARQRRPDSGGAGCGD